MIEASGVTVAVHCSDFENRLNVIAAIIMSATRAAIRVIKARLIWWLDVW